MSLPTFTDIISLSNPEISEAIIETENKLFNLRFKKATRQSFKANEIKNVKQKIGIVISNKMQKTVVVKIENRYPHPMYSKTLIKTTKYLAHDELEECKVGDQVLVEECRPLSKRKRWKLIKILSKSSLIS